MHISSRLTDSEYGAGSVLKEVRTRERTYLEDSLHLAVSMRSFLAENVSEFVKALLDREQVAARRAFCKLASRYPIVLSRDLHEAKQWIRTRARGTERYGLVASSKAHRLKPDAIDIRVDVDPVHWFLTQGTTHGRATTSKTRPRHFRCRGSSLIGRAWLGMGTCGVVKTAGDIIFFAETAGAVSVIPRSSGTSATLTACC
jgi:hypothetical protein